MSFVGGKSAVVVALGPEGAAAGATLAMTTTSAQTAAIALEGFVDIIADAACFIECGPNPTAVINTSYYLPSGITYRFPISAGNKIAARTVSGTGNLWYHPVI